MFIILIFIFIYVTIFSILFKQSKRQDNPIIIGIISKLSINKSKYFFKSLGKIKFKGKLIVFVDKKENMHNYSYLNIDYLFFNNTFPYYPINDKKYHVDISFIKKTYPQLYKIKKHNFFIWIVRYYMIYTLIKFHGKENEIYLLSDIKDVIFQYNPFQWKYKKGLYLVEESNIKSLKESTYGWMKPYTIDDIILKNRVLNGGIIFGSHREMKMFLKEYINGYTKEGKYGIDQAYLNYFYYSKKKFIYPINICKANKCFAKCIIQEIRYTTNMIINKTDMKIYNDDGSLPALIHQYTYAFDKPPIYRQKLFEYYRRIRSRS